MSTANRPWPSHRQLIALGLVVTGWLTAIDGYFSVEMQSVDTRGGNGEVTSNDILTSVFHSEGTYRGAAGFTPPAKKPSRGYCHFGQMPTLKGTWEPHPDPQYQGIYVQKTECPEFASDFDCLDPQMIQQTHDDLELARAEYNKVFVPDGCDLHAWSPEGFMRCLGGRRIIMIGDSLMRQSFQSLACLLSPVTSHGHAGLWDSTTSNVNGNYTARGAPMPILKQFVGNFFLQNGASVHLRSYGQFNVTLWDHVLREFGTLTERDVLMVNFGAWYPRFKISVFDCYDSWHAFKVDMHQLIIQRLRMTRAVVYWKDYAPSHFGGRTGTFTGIDEQFPEVMDPHTQCYPATVGEFWYGDYIRDVLQDCGMKCAHIRILPIFDMSLSRPHIHHGTFGRGLHLGIRDCRHYCQPVVDMWNVILYNMECFTNPGRHKKKKKRRSHASGLSVRDALQLFQKPRQPQTKAPHT